mgnify:FL=1
MSAAPVITVKNTRFGTKRTPLQSRASIGHFGNVSKPRSAIASRPVTGLHTKHCSIARNASARLSVSATATSTAPQIIWFRVGDLRTHDHPALFNASKQSSKVVPVFVFDITEMENFTPAVIRATWEAVVDLSSKLKTHSLELVVRVGDPSTELPELLRELNASTISVQMELEWARRGTYTKTISALEENKVEINEWSLELREETDASKEKETAVVKSLLNDSKSAPLTAFPTPESRSAARGGIAKPLDAPEAFQASAASKIEIPLGSIPSLSTCLGWSNTPDEPDDVKHDAAVELASKASNNPALQKKRKATGTENSFVLFSEEAVKKRAAEEAIRQTPSVPFRLPGGETSALRCFSGFLDFYTATNDVEYKRMYDKVLEVGKPNAFFLLFGNALRTGSLSPRLVYDKCMAWEANSKRATDLCANARNVAALRDYQEAVARDALKAKVCGPGVPLVGAYNVTQGKL